MTDTATEALRIFGVVALILCGGLFSGCTLGIMGLDTNQLQVRVLGGPMRQSFLLCVRWLCGGGPQAAARVFVVKYIHCVTVRGAAKRSWAR